MPSWSPYNPQEQATTRSDLHALREPLGSVRVGTELDVPLPASPFVLLS